MQKPCIINLAQSNFSIPSRTPLSPFRRTKIFAHREMFTWWNAHWILSLFMSTFRTFMAFFILKCVLFFNRSMIENTQQLQEWDCSLIGRFYIIDHISSNHKINSEMSSASAHIRHIRRVITIAMHSWFVISLHFTLKLVVFLTYLWNW